MGTTVGGALFLKSFCQGEQGFGKRELEQPQKVSWLDNFTQGNKVEHRAAL